MPAEMGKNQTDPHPSIQLVRRSTVEPTTLARERGRTWQLFGPADGSSLDVHVIELDPSGPAGHYHVHTASENVYVVLDGAVDVRHSEGTARLVAGDAVRFPPGVAHGAQVVGETKAMLLEIYAPAPADFVLVDEARHETLRS